LPKLLKQSAIAVTDLLRVGSIAVPMPAGNIAVVGYKA